MNSLFGKTASETILALQSSVIAVFWGVTAAILSINK